MRIIQQLRSWNTAFVTMSIGTTLDRFLSVFSAEKQLSDRLFWMLFYVCVGLLPPLIAIFGHKTVYLPMLIISILIIARFFMRKDCRRAMVAQLTSPGILLLGSFATLVAIHALLGVIDDPGRLRILAKPVTILVITILLAFIWSHRDIFKTDLLFKMAFAGVLAGFSVTIVKVVVMQLFMGIGYTLEPRSIISDFMKIHGTVHAELKILSIFVFTSVFAIKALGKRYGVLVGLLAVMLLVSFFTMGTSGDTGIVVLDQNETVQFGIALCALVLALAYVAPRLMTNLVFGGIVFVLASAPWLFQLWYMHAQTLPLPRANKFLVRGEIWDAVGAKALESPWFGFGIDSVRYLKHIDMKNDYIPFDGIHHPHNMILQLWLDLGLAGVLIVAGLLYLGWRFVSRIKPSVRPPILAGLAMLTLFTMVTHSLWQTWSMALIVFFIALVSVHRTHIMEKTS
jgi:O-antigen ligase